ncbi:ECF transporter S component [Sporolactobacillus spathodeae]|uniref:Membrane protein n=1 Tax=Sporolactobacillus spathodeae TaxID=1465502 RepID=A0ABS2Q670_9BACL|nr:ECF transporter S component [Sporolactobacillus spathodeae]MBM7657101.1 putative membrane protein [Sporolactobacillus spathodeae]
MVHMTRQNKTYRLVLLSILTAIIILQTFVPMLGNIPIGVFSLTLIHITVIITAIVLGPWEGALIGGFWGVGSCLRAYLSPYSPIEMLIFTNPLVAVLPRVLVGLAAGYSYRFLRKVKLPDIPSMALSAVFGAVTNTVLVLGLIYIFYRQPYANFLHVSFSGLLPALLLIVVSNGIPEAIAAGVIAPIVSKALRRVVPESIK